MPYEKKINASFCSSESNAVLITEAKDPQHINQAYLCVPVPALMSFINSSTSSSKYKPLPTQTPGLWILYAFNFHKFE